MTPPRRPVGRPPLPPEERRVVRCLRLHPSTDARLAELAEAAGTDRSEVVERMIWEAGARDEADGRG